MKYYFATLAFLCLILSACTDEFKEKNNSDLDDSSSISTIDPDIEALHSFQTDKNIIISSMIIQDQNSGKFILDLSLNDAELLGISKEAYEEAKNIAYKMNESDIQFIN